MLPAILAGGPKSHSPPGAGPGWLRRRQGGVQYGRWLSPQHTQGTTSAEKLTRDRHAYQMTEMCSSSHIVQHFCFLKEEFFFFF